MSEPLIRLLHATFAAPAGGVADAELLARVAATRDDAAFELLVRRHAGLVWRIARSVTRDHHAAEDSFQAAFLALATRAPGIRGSVAGWLSRVAYHAALKARRARARAHPTATAELQTSVGAQPSPSPEANEQAEALHAELNRLPERYRLPIVLCHLHGRTQAEAARELGLPVGTVATRVRRGLDRLRGRLLRRGVSPAALPGLLASNEFLTVPHQLIVAVIPFAATSAKAPVEILRLSQGALSAMKPSNWKLLVSLALLVSSLFGAAFALGPVGERTAERPGEKTSAKPAPAPRPATHAQTRGSQDNLRKVVAALHAYVEAHGHFPHDITDKGGKPLLSWRVAILPWLDQDFLYAQFKLDEPWDGPNNRKLLAFMPRPYRAPVQDARSSETFVQGVAGPRTVFDPKTKVRILEDIPDGTVNTLLLVEAGPAVPWTKPGGIPFDPRGKLPVLAGPYTDAVHIATADGSTYRMTTKPDADLLRALILRDDGLFLDLEKLRATPTKPGTEEDRKLLEQTKAHVARRVRQAAEAAEERYGVEQELRKLGPLPQPDPSRVETLEELEEMAKDLEERDRADWREHLRLLAALEKKAPKTAERIKAEQQKRWEKRAKEKEQDFNPSRASSGVSGQEPSRARSAAE
jgi:RNA polymerase sigma factor (sigma-70 family)